MKRNTATWAAALFFVAEPARRLREPACKRRAPADFATEWNAILASIFAVKDDVSPAPGRTATGVSCVEAGADVEANGRGFFAGKRDRRRLDDPLHRRADLRRHPEGGAGRVGQGSEQGKRAPGRLLGHLHVERGLGLDLHYPDVDELRLQGSWTSYADPSDPQLATLPAGQKPVISFSKDRRFNDEGLSLAFLHWASADKSAEGPGSGTYEVKNYTLVVKCADGRVKTAAISGLLGVNPATNSQYPYVERTRLTQMKEAGAPRQSIGPAASLLFGTITRAADSTSEVVDNRILDMLTIG